MRGPLTAARSNPEIMALSNSFWVTWCWAITACTLSALAAYSYSIFSCLRFSSSGSIFSPTKDWITWKNDFDLSLNLLISRFDPSLFGPKQEVWSLMYLISFWEVFCSARIWKKVFTNRLALANFILWNFSMLCCYESSKQSLKPLKFLSIHLTISKSRPTALTLILQSLLAVESYDQPLLSLRLSWPWILNFLLC